MALREILTVPEWEHFLRQPARPVEAFDERLHQLLEDMRETLYKRDGVGLAAPQVGVRRRVVLIDAGDGLMELINPEIIYEDGQQVGDEGCLSIPGIQKRVVRPMSVAVRAKDRYGRDVEYSGQGLKARAFCHEIDHLNGVLFIDHVQEEQE
jgi:peptide deformylase